jgi:PAT family beta-lactamase induction signal transducer AmpG
MKKLPPIPLLALTNATYGMYIGFVAAGLPILLAARQVPEARIATITAVALTPMFWSFLVGPVLDVRFSRRTYAAVFALVSATLLTTALIELRDLALFESLMLLGTLTVSLSQYALGGWLVSLVPRSEETRLSAWFNVANIGGAGLMVLAAGALLQHLTLTTAALALGILLLLPLAIFPLLPAPGPDRRLATETFPQFFSEIFTLLRRRDVLLALALFVTPCAAFAMTNVLAGLGADFHTPAAFVTLIAGLGTVAAGITASLLLPTLARAMRLRPLYLTIGIAGAIFTLSLLRLPQTPAGFAIAMVGETFFQTLAITNAFALQFEIVGPANPLASTLLAVLGSAMNLPMTYMVYTDGRLYANHGLPGSLSIDAICGLVACALLFTLFRFTRQRPSSSHAAPRRVGPVE